MRSKNEEQKKKFEQTDKAAHELLQDNADYAWDNKCYKQALDSISDIIHKTTDIGGLDILIDNKEIFKANTVEDAIDLLEIDLFSIKPVEILDERETLIDITKLIEGEE